MKRKRKRWVKTKNVEKEEKGETKNVEKDEKRGNEGCGKARKGRRKDWRGKKKTMA